MKRFATVAALFAAGALSCVFAPVTQAQVSSSAESACMVAVNDKYGGRVNNLEIVHSEFSQANSLVMIDADGESWRCLVSNDGNVQELSKQSGGGQGGKHRAISSGAHDEYPSSPDRDRFPTVCGVMVGGQNYRYRCKVSDAYEGGRKVETVLTMPDQVIKIRWGSGRDIKLIFEDMTPQSASYSTSEGETNFRFEDKTYYYISDRRMAEMELQNFRD